MTIIACLIEFLIVAICGPVAAGDRFEGAGE